MMGEPVARILDIAFVGSRATPYVFRDGTFFQIIPTIGKGQGHLVRHPVNVVVIRNGKVAVGHNNMLLNVGDMIRTSPDCIIAIEFLVGGRVGVNKDSCAEIVNERSVADGETSWRRILARNLNSWTNGHSRALKDPIEIQTNGGTLGVRG